MPATTPALRHCLRSGASRALWQRVWAIPSLHLACITSRRCFYDGGQSLVVEEVVADDRKRGVLKKYIDEYKTSFKVPKPDFFFPKDIAHSQIGQTVTAVGFLAKRRDIGRALTFVPLLGGNGERVQVFARAEVNDEVKQALRQIPENSAVSVTGVLGMKYEEKEPKKNPGSMKRREGHCLINEVEIRVQKIDCLSSFPKELKHQPNHQYEPRHRHLQLRFDEKLSERLRFRSEVAAFARRALSDFQEVETPILFKSTPEGAREFIVPTRRRGYAYGLPQSPQQYKQILMASGIYRYFQFAKCFRDEDHRADRQPEFTQIDLEMAWADGEDVMLRVERFIKDLWEKFAQPGTAIASALPNSAFLRMTYDEAMSKHGSDKPDLRIKDLIYRIDHVVPADLKRMLTSIEDPIIEAFKIRLDADTATAKRFIQAFMDSPDAEVFRHNPAGGPGVSVVNLQSPLEGLQAFGFEGSAALKDLYTEAQGSNTEFEEGDLLLVQSRENLPHIGGSTMIGRLRLAIHKAALAQKLIQPDHDHHFLWITDFPMFTANDGSEPGQEGESGFSATHHPFTAPKTEIDVDLLMIDPLRAIADHYDLVLNGVELGGGSRRIHNAEMQKVVMRDILKINPKRLSDFQHLFLALEAGCPPHAGLAIGFDRLVAVMQGRDSVRDVIAFPKDKNGSDPLIGSPSYLSKQRMADYHLEIKDDQAYLRESQQREVELQKVKALESLKVLLDAVTKWSSSPAGLDGLGRERSTIGNTIYENATGGITQGTPEEASRYRPGELLPYAMMLYNQVGGKFLHESLKGFEALIESLGKDIQKGTRFEDIAGIPGELSREGVRPQKPTAAMRLEQLHGELVKEIFSQLRSVDSIASFQASEDLRTQLLEVLEPVKLLHTSLKNLEPMLEGLNTEFESRIREKPITHEQETATSDSPSPFFHSPDVTNANK